MIFFWTLEQVIDVLIVACVLCVVVIKETDKILEKINMKCIST